MRKLLTAAAVILVSLAIGAGSCDGGQDPCAGHGGVQNSVQIAGGGGGGQPGGGPGTTEYFCNDGSVVFQQTG